MKRHCKNPLLTKSALLLLMPLVWLPCTQAEVQPGDIAVVRIHADADWDKDGFTWIALRDFEAGELKWIDNGWGKTIVDGKATDWYYKEGTEVNIFLEGPVAAGTMGDVYFGRPYPDWGDQLFLYTGRGPSVNVRTEEDAGFVWGLQYGEPWMTDGRVTENTQSHEPETLKTLGLTVALGAGAHWYYSGTTTGTVEQLLSEIRNPDNWSLADPEGSTWNDLRSETFTILATPVPEPSTYALCAALACLGAVLIRSRRTAAQE